MTGETIALLVRNLVFLCCLVKLSMSDFKEYKIPDHCLVISAVAWIMAIPFAFHFYGGWSGIFSHLMAAVIYGSGIFLIAVLMEHILKRDSLGGGDIKLIAVMGLYLGMDETLYAMLGACILTLAVMLWPRTKSRKKRDVFPFGPALAVATGVMVLWDFCRTL